ncbi:unnamed protein product [Parnassius apollo]|uniref:(apollo) hypothetical protein n=1 Tax=Parnassius apollo TaxID=110799 RepID=A0A8S3WVQ8_PARAO|nr:unnamed protein product [Parnassius apollo]
MPNQVLNIEPQNELKFKGLFEQGFTTYMRLTNPSPDTVLFKIKTTAPKKYCVRPNSGVLEPNSKVDIAITPQPVYVDPNEKHKHKFMVQSVVAPEGWDGKTNIDQVWKEISPDQLMDYKLKCVFETPRVSNLNDAGDNAAQNEVTKKRIVAADDAKPSTKEAVEGLIQNEGKRKDDDHTGGTLSAQTTLPFPKSDNVESDLQKATSEVILLREEESKLRHENLQLKEELLRLHQSMGEGRTARRHSYGPEKNAQASMMPWIAIAVGMAFLGIIIGKFLM